MIVSTILFCLVYLMAGPVAACSGSSGGSEPPPNPHRLPTHCELAPVVRARTRGKARRKGKGVTKRKGKGVTKRNGRGVAKGLDIISAVANGGKLQVTFDMDGKTYKAVGPNSTWWQSAVGISTRECCDPFYDQWVDVPNYQKAMIRKRMLDYFDLDLDGILREVLDRDANECYNDWKGSISRHFKNNGGMPTALNHKPRSVKNKAQWKQCCMRFSSAKFQAASQRNSQNRHRTEDTSLHGRKAYVQYLDDKRDPETGEQYSAIENWKDQRTRGGQWTNEAARNKYENMSIDRQAQLASGSVNERAIMDRNLGKRRRRLSGMGPTLRKSAFRYVENPESGEGTSSLSQAYATIQRKDNEIVQLRNALSRYTSDFQVAPPDDPPSSSSDFDDDDDDEEDAAYLED